MHAVILLCLCSCLCNNSKWCLPSFVSPSSCTVLLLCCFLLNITACTAAQLGGCTFERRAPFATTSFKKRVDIFSRVDLFSGDYGKIFCANFKIHLSVHLVQHSSSNHNFTFVGEWSTILYTSLLAKSVTSNPKCTNLTNGERVQI